MSKWIHTTLKDVCLKEKGSIISGPFGSNISSKFFVKEGVPVIRGNNLSLSLDKFYDDGFVFVTKEKAEELNCYAQKGDLLFTAAGTIGQVGILESPLKYEKYVISNKQLRARIDTTKVSLLYAYYWFASSWMQDYFIRNNKGSTVPLITLTELKDAPISYPEDLSVQRKIVENIESISCKIDINRNICSELESMAKTLYDYWFTQFDFPNEEGKPYRSSGGAMEWNEQLKREIPKGWETDNIQNTCSVIDCLHSQKPEQLYVAENYYLLQLENLVDLGLIDLHSKYYVSKDMYELWTSRIQLEDGDLVVTNAGRVGAVSRIPQHVIAGIGRNMTAIRPNTVPPFFLYYFFKSPDFSVQMRANTDSGAFFCSLNVRGIKQLLLTVPPANSDILKRFDSIVEPMRRKIESLQLENEELTKLRDWLLPMLMNGQATVE